MKKLFTFLLICLVNTTQSALDISEHSVRITSKEDDYESYFLNSDEMRVDKYLKKEIDEYTTTDLEVQVFDEYDQNVSQDTQPPALSPTQEKLAQILGKLLIYYFNAQQAAHAYFQEIKEIISNWYVIITKTIK